MKKNLFFAAIAATAVMTGCSKNEAFDLASPDSLDNIEFASVIGKQTRANEMTTDGLKASGEIKMYNYATTGNFNVATDMAKYFDNQPEPLSYAAGQGWVTGKAYKWSELGVKVLNIFSVHPTLADAAAFTEPTISTPAKFAYTVQNDPQLQQDLIASAALNLTKDNTAGKINLKFRHILSQVKFKVQTDNSNFRIRLKSLTVAGAKNASDFTFAKVAPTAPSTVIGSWGTPTGSASYKYVDGGTQIYTNTVEEVAGDGGVLMILPQVAATDFKFKIIYDVLDDVSEDVISADVEKEAEMVGMQMGKKYVYTLIVPNENADQIRFSVDVDEWEVSVIEHERKFEVLTLNATIIADKVKAYATAAQTAGKNSYVHTVQVNGAVIAPFTVDLSVLAAVKKDSKIVLDFTKVTGIDATNKITVIAPAAGWTLSAAALSAPGSITLTKN